MKTVLFGCSALVLMAAQASAQEVQGPPAKPVQAAQAGNASGDTPKPASCTGDVDPYKNYACLDQYLGTGFFERLFNYYKLEWGQGAAPSDPNAPPSRRDGWPATPETTPPMPFTEWPYGGTTSVGVNRTGSVDSPLMVAMANTDLGDWMGRNGLQFYGWVNVGGNVSSSTVRPGGNAPAAYDFTPNTVQLDQAVLYFERTPDTVQSDHIDWGFRISGIYGENYRYTTSYGLGSYQLLKYNDYNGYDFPMLYAEVFIPQIAQGLMIRVGRYISVPDIEAQLAPNNYMYSHSITYSFDNFTNEGVMASLFVMKNLALQLGVNTGTEATIWHAGVRIANPDPNPLYPGATMLKDPGSQPSVTACIRYTTPDSDTDIYPCADAINNGNWGYNNLQWFGTTIYHKFNDHWHVSYEIYDLYQKNVPNLNNPIAAAAIANGGTPFSPQYVPFNAPDGAQCRSAAVLSCTARAIGTVAYVNYSPDALNNFSLRPEFYDDQEGQRTGVKTRYVDLGLGWQHWLSPQIEFRPEVTYYVALDAPAFDGDFNAGIPPTKKHELVGAGDVIFHF